MNELMRRRRAIMAARPKIVYLYRNGFWNSALGTVSAPFVPSGARFSDCVLPQTLQVNQGEIYMISKATDESNAHVCFCFSFERPINFSGFSHPKILVDCNKIANFRDTVGHIAFSDANYPSTTSDAEAVVNKIDTQGLTGSNTEYTFEIPITHANQISLFIFDDYPLTSAYTRIAIKEIRIEEGSV